LRWLLVLFAAAAMAHAQPTSTQLLDTTYFAFGNPATPGNCALVITFPASSSGATFLWPMTEQYTVLNGVVDIWLQPNSATYSVEANCTFGVGADQFTQTASLFLAIPVSATPVTMLQVLSPGSIAPSALIPLAQLSAAGSSSGQQICSNGSSWSAGICPLPNPFDIPGTTNIGSGAAHLHMYDVSGNDTVLNASGAGLAVASVLFASLGIPPYAGTLITCSNCDTPGSPGAGCTSSGDRAGALALWIRGAWKCY
jgi:hypothetical protein